MRSLGSSDLVVTLPEQGADQGYWAQFTKEILPRLEDTFRSVIIAEPGNDGFLPSGNQSSSLYLGIAPSREVPAPAHLGSCCWIPRLGHGNLASHPWQESARILLPLGAGAGWEGTPVSFLGCGVKIVDMTHSVDMVVVSWDGPDGSEERWPALEESCRFVDGATDTAGIPGASIAVIWTPEGVGGIPHFLHALGSGAIPIIPSHNMPLRHICDFGSLGLPCRDRDEAARAVRYLQAHEHIAEQLRMAGRRFVQRKLSWTKLWRRLEAALEDMRAPKPHVQVVVLNWNGGVLLPDCLESLREQEYPAMLPVVVDNGSSDGSVDFVRSVFPECRILTNRKNLGFARGNNGGMQRALEEGADYVVLLNNDTRVARRWLKELVAVAEREPDAGAVGSKMLFYDKPRTINSAGGRMNQSFYGWDRGVYEHDGRRWNARTDCRSVTGGSVLLRSSALRQVGLFDPVYFAYYEDNDLCHRLRLQAWRIVYAPKSKVFHKHSATSGPVSSWKTFLLERSRYRFILKNAPFSYLSRHALEMMAQEVSEIRSWMSAREYRRILLQIKAAASALLHIPNILAWRIFRSTGRDTGWIRELASGFPRPIFPLLLEEFSDLYAGLVPQGRFLPACMDEGLKGKWSAEVSQLPRFRTLHGRGSIILSNKACSRGFLQIHAFLSPEVPHTEMQVALTGGRPYQVSIPQAGWHTLRVEANDVPANVCVSLRTKVPIGINEISLLAPHSPLLRALLP